MRRRVIKGNARPSWFPTPDGRLYLSGQDLAELYAVAIPDGGGVLYHLATLPVEAEGQAIDWDESDKGVLYGITRRTREILRMKAPPLAGR
jgi:hypothetical protein